MKKIIAAVLAVHVALFASAVFAVVEQSANSNGEYTYTKKADGTVEWPFAL